MRLFDESTLRKMEQLALSADSVRLGAMKGNRRSRKKGTSIEFADYRNYVQGDDLRRLDWNVFARLERPFVKLTEEEEDLSVHVLLDTSGSMNWPQEEERASENKLRYAMRLAGALGYIGLATGDVVQVVLFDTLRQHNWGPFRGRSNGWPLLQFLEANHSELERDMADRRTMLDLWLRDYSQRSRRPGLLFLISDLLTPGDYRTGLSALLARGYEIVVLHLLSPDEVHPNLSGDLKLRDMETGEFAEVTIDPWLIEQYTQRMDNWRAELEGFCVPRGIHYVNIMTDVPWDRLIFETLRRQGIVA